VETRVLFIPVVVYEDGIAEDPETLIIQLTSTAASPYVTGLGTVRLTLVDLPATPVQRPEINALSDDLRNTPRRQPAGGRRCSRMSRWKRCCATPIRCRAF
jgi:hypothetical protein